MNPDQDSKPEINKPSKQDGSILESENKKSELNACPRCGMVINSILWGNTNCPNCGLHFECC